jgi:hypothetical protein
MLDFPRLLARGLLIHFPDPNAYCHRLAEQFRKHVIAITLFPTVQHQQVNIEFLNIYEQFGKESVRDVLYYGRAQVLNTCGRGNECSEEEKGSATRFSAMVA